VGGLQRAGSAAFQVGEIGREAAADYSAGSRHLRRALYMPALVALRRAYLRAFYQNLLARGKTRLQAVVAVMRKLLHALFAMFRTNQPYDGSKLCAVALAVNTIAACA
jgi:transposase